MKILVIESSPHTNGSSNLLASEFIRGAKENGHDITIFNAAKANIAPCLGCDFCGMTSPCCQKDDMQALREAILATDMLVFVTPLYYFGFSAQMKKVIDRFYAFNSQLSGKGLKAVLIAAAWDSNTWTMQDLQAHYETLCKYLHFKNMGEVLGTGCGTLSMTNSSPFMKKAYELGKSL